MADPICRWRNPYVNTIVELVKALPHEEMPSSQFRAIIEERWPGFLHTPYQLACQVGLYYESDDGIFYPRFNHDIDEKEARSYMEKWIAKYYVPNPYTKSMKTLQQPQPFLAAIIGYVYEHPNETELHSILETVFQEKIGNIDIISNVLNSYTDLIKVDGLGNVELTAKAIDFMKYYINRNDKKAFFDIFSESNNDADIISKNLIVYGAPGTGKSHKIMDDGNVKKADEKNLVFRTTFHPDSDYSTFVGCYKPTTQGASQQTILDYDSLVDRFKKYISDFGNITHASAAIGYNYHDSIVRMQESGVHTIADLLADAHKSGTTYDTTIRSGMLLYEEQVMTGKTSDKITYTFVPQAFTNAYVKAWNTKDPVFLIIEEINRGNCAQIFGDLFQLLDRKNGVSEYPIDADSDLADHIRNELAKSQRTDFPNGVKEGKKLVLPSNLYIWATMNTSDQSLFPIDSAFKRRWDWKYMKIKNYPEKNYKIKLSDKEYDWWEFIHRINEIIASMTSSADKQLGYFFCKAAGDGTISPETFVSKVIFYLWNDVFKDYGFEDASLFRYKSDKDEMKDLTFPDFYDEDGEKVNETRLKDFLDKVQNWKKDDNKNND